MFCPNCGFSLPDGASFCPGCGKSTSNGPAAAARPAEPAPEKDHDSAKLFGFFSSKAFLAVCILVTAAAVASLAFGVIELISILLSVGCWIAFGGAKAQKRSLIGSGVKVMSVSSRIVFVLYFVAAGLIILSGILILAVFGFVGSGFSTLSSLYHEYIPQLHRVFEFTPAEEEIIDFLYNVNIIFGKVSLTLIGSVLFTAALVIAGIIIALNLIFTGPFCSYLSGLCRTIKDPSTDKPQAPKSTRISVLLVILAVFTAIPAIASLASPLILVPGHIITGFVVPGLLVAAMIVASRLISNGD
ncbi:MAG: zinc ribbon domain-containing protein [Clostridia bacterium]|nr:zinc ribbon domain-containing protein [Clostridia bacterium]